MIEGGRFCELADWPLAVPSRAAYDFAAIKHGQRNMPCMSARLST